MSRTPVSEAPLEPTAAGVEPQGEGWFIVNLADAAAVDTPEAGHAWTFEAGGPPFPHLGINVHSLGPGEPASKYHAEAAQEAFLVLRGECLLVVEGQERRLRQWDFFHAPPGTAHALIGAGDGRCAVLMVGARLEGAEVVYPVDATAARHGASVEQETRSPAEAHADWEPPRPARRRWPPA